MFEFNPRGNLIPTEIIPTSWDVFFDFFAKPSTDNKRSEIGIVLLAFLQKIYFTINQQTFDVWINGSYTTLKESPNDVDILIHIPATIYDQYGSQIRQLINSSKKDSNGYIDAYLIIVLDTSHKSYSFYQFDLIEWKSIFGKTKPTRSGQRFSKGVLNVTFNEKAK